MRRQLVTTLAALMKQNEKIVILLGDIGVYAFSDLASRYPGRVVNCGISEQAMIGMASGLAGEGYLPVVYTISAFLVERAFEQIKIDIGAMGRKAILIGVGGSYDYAAYGPTHHCPADIGLLYNIPGIDLAVPASPTEADALLRHYAGDNTPSVYLRLSDRGQAIPGRLTNSRIVSYRHRAELTVIAVGPALFPVTEALGNACANLVYVNSVRPFPAKLLEQVYTRRYLVVEQYYPVLAPIVAEIIGGPVEVKSMGVKREFLHGYGKPEDLDKAAGLAVEDIEQAIKEME